MSSNARPRTARTPGASSARCCAHLRQEFIAPAAAIVGYAEILIEDAKRLSLDSLSRRPRAHPQRRPALHALAAIGAGTGAIADDSVIFDQSKLRHDLRTPINAIKGYGEMLVEDAAMAVTRCCSPISTSSWPRRDGMLKRIDALVDFRGDCRRRRRRQAAGRHRRRRRGGPGDPRRRRSAGRTASVHGRILVVDDNASNRDLLGRQLTRAGHAVPRPTAATRRLAQAREREPST